MPSPTPPPSWTPAQAPRGPHRADRAPGAVLGAEDTAPIPPRPRELGACSLHLFTLEGTVRGSPLTEVQV